MRTSRFLAVLAGGALAIGPALPAAANHDVTPARIGGDTRYGTAAEIAHADFPDGASEVIVASGTRYPDALAGAPVAAELDAPIVLTEQDRLPDATFSAIDELGAEHVTILGGEVAVSQDVEDTINEDLDVPTDRIAGETRYETAADLARFVQDRNDNQSNWPGGQRAAFLTTGENFPDALSAGAPAASRDADPIPVLLTRPDEVPAETEAVIEEQDVEVVIIVGGPEAVSDDVQASIDDEDTTTDRWAGETRTETATVVADKAMEFLGFDAADLTLTRGDLFPDALAVAPLSGGNRNPILLTRDSDELSDHTRVWLGEQCDAVDRIRGIGQEQALSEAVLNDAEQAAEDCHGEDQSYEVLPQEFETTAVGTEYTFEVPRHDDADFGAPDVVLFPREAVREPVDGDFRFTDENDDGHADGIESTETGAAVITAVNGEDVQDTKGVRDVEARDTAPGIQATVTSDAADDVAFVVFDDENDNSALDLAADGRPTEDWGFSGVEFVG